MKNIDDFARVISLLLGEDSTQLKHQMSNRDLLIVQGCLLALAKECQTELERRDKAKTHA